MFASNYLKKNKVEPLVSEPPEKDTGIVVVIPCLLEPDIVQTLESLKRCSRPKCIAEVIIVVNQSETAAMRTQQYNQNTKNLLDEWIRKNNSTGIRFYAVGPVVLRKKWAGAGLARKTGMDEATRRFDVLQRENGIIVSLDADTLVEQNYLTALEEHFSRFPKHVGATLAFEHRKQGLSPQHLEGIERYEKYLLYYKRALDFTGFPYAMFTIGSAFAVRADAYVKRGGMNRRQAGEDFYFLQHLAYLGTIGEISNTTVHPSARLSERVPFGTGPVLKKWMNGDERLLKTYDFRAFQHLQAFFEIIPDLFKIEQKKFLMIIDSLPPELADFLVQDAFWGELNDLNNNCATLSAFQNRFFQKFNAFKILKCLNFLQKKYYPAVDLDLQFQLLQNSIALKMPPNVNCI